MLFDSTRTLLRTILRSRPAAYRPVGFLDPDPATRNRTLHSVRVAGDNNPFGVAGRTTDLCRRPWRCGARVLFLRVRFPCTGTDMTLTPTVALNQPVSLRSRAGFKQPLPGSAHSTRVVCPVPSSLPGRPRLLRGSDRESAALSDNPLPHRVQDQLRHAMQAQLLQDMRPVRLHGRQPDIEHVCHFLVRPALSD